MAKTDTYTIEGIVTESLPNAMFRVKRKDNEEEILAHVSGKMRIYHIKILPGDSVKVEMTKYDEKRGRIIFRGK